jgi:hypothetical protein
MIFQKKNQGILQVYILFRDIRFLEKAQKKVEG